MMPAGPPDDSQEHFIARAAQALDAANDAASVDALVAAAPPLAPLARVAFEALVTAARRRLENTARLAAAERRFTQLRDASAQLTSSLDYGVALESVANVFVPALADWCTVKIFEDTVPRVFVGHRDPARIETLRKVASGPAGRLEPSVIERLTRGEAVRAERVRDILAEAGHGLFGEELGGTAVLVGLVARGRMFGALTLGRMANAPFEDADLDTVVEVTRRAALAVDNARLYREALQAGRAREGFLAMASHELRTPLTSLLLEVQLTERIVARQPGELEHVQRRLAAVRRQAQRLAGLVHDLLDVSRIDAGRLELQPADTDLVAVTRAALERFSAETAALGIELTFDGPEEARGSWDASRLDQVVTNLVSNALKYGLGKPVAVRIEDLPDEVRLSVRDHGPGVPEADRTRIFERFARAAPRGHGGFGLGLWIVREIVEAHRGSVHVVDAPGGGSVFEVVLPRAGGS